MISPFSYATVLLLSAYLLAVSSALPTISVKGTKFFLDNGAQFFIKGVAYKSSSTSPVDMLSNSTQCALDVPLMKSLGVNSVNIYDVYLGVDHSGCMKTFADAGIYVWIFLAEGGIAIDQKNPSWTSTLFTAYTKLIDEFIAYDNTAAFWIGDKVVIDANTTIAAPYIKAVARDLKAYRNAKGYREVPFGYSASDAYVAYKLQTYLGCGSNRSETIDFYGTIMYSWCGAANFDSSGYDAMYSNVSGYNLPILFSETGCATILPRVFGDQHSLLGGDMNDVFSGSFIYAWFDPDLGRGLISYSSTQATGTPTPIPSLGFTDLQSQWATLKPTGTPSASYTPSLTPPACPNYTANAWLVNGTGVLPPPAYITLPARLVNQTVAPTANVSAATAVPAPSNTPEKAEPLPFGAKVCIVVGIVFLILIIAFFAFNYRRIRRARSLAQSLQYLSKSELASCEIMPPANTSGMHEMDNRNSFPAADTSGIHELEGSCSPTPMSTPTWPDNIKSPSLGQGRDQEIAVPDNDIELALRSPSLNAGPGPDVGIGSSRHTNHSSSWDTPEFSHVVSPLSPVYMGTMSGSADTGNMADERRLYQLYLQGGPGRGQVGNGDGEWDRQRDEK